MAMVRKTVKMDIHKEIHVVKRRVMTNIMIRFYLLW